jgi:hypothetical protein
MNRWYGPERKAVEGFAHRFQPTYPGFPVEGSGVEQLHAAFFERKPHTWLWLILDRRKSGQRWCEQGAPVWSCLARHTLEGEACGIPHLAKNERDAPNFLYAALDRTACAALLKGEPHEVQGTHETPQEIGVWGTRRLVAGIERKARSKGGAMLFLKDGCPGDNCRSLHYAPAELRSG